jgi:aminomethyltransferase
MGLRTPLYSEHLADKAKIVDFAGWEMPLHYGSQVREHHAVRRDAGMFDVSHMTVVDVHGEQAQTFLRMLLANDVARLKTPGKALYTCMLNPRGGVIDDLIVYFLAPGDYRLVVNAATREKDLDWIQSHAGEFGAEVTERRDTVMIAVQGPNARARVLAHLAPELAGPAQALKPFQAARLNGWLVARTGYTGEDGFELILPAADAIPLWRELRAAGVAPAGLGARDTLRLEAGMNLYGSDMDEDTTPLESGLAWTVAWQPEDRDFIGRAALQAQRDAGCPRKLVGLLLEGRGVLRNHQELRGPRGETGEVVSGGFSPTLERSIALARVSASLGEHCEVRIRSAWQPARVVKPPFVRGGKALIEI